MGKILWNSHRASYDLWADLPSPIKTTFRNSCYEQIKKLYQQTGYKYQAYIPAEPAGGADAEDMIMNMPLQKIPGAYLAMGFGAPEIQRPPAGAGGILPQGELRVFPRSDGHR